MSISIVNKTKRSKYKKETNKPHDEDIPSVNNFFTNNDKSIVVKNSKDLPWIEKYRPDTLESISSHDHIIYALKNFIKNKSLPHLLFYGPPGTGKTSTITACARDLYKEHFPYMVLEFNASDDRGVEVVRDKIKTFVYSKNFFCKGFKLVILDEIDAMTIEAQKILRQVIEKYSDNARFCLICNYVSKIIYALQSRCTKFRFSPLSKVQMKNRLLDISQDEDINITMDGLDTIINLCGGDMRKAVNVLQSTHLIYNLVDATNVYNSTNSFNDEDVKCILNWIEIMSFKECYNNSIQLLYTKGLDLNNLLIHIKRYLVITDIPTKQKLFLYDKLADIEFQNTVTSNDKIQLGAMIGAFKISANM